MKKDIIIPRSINNNEKLEKQVLLLIVLLLVLLFIGIGIWGVNIYKKTSEAKRASLESEYMFESKAFAMHSSNSYQDFSNVSVNDLTISLVVYKKSNENADISIEAIKEYLSSEFDVEGKQRILNPPQNIANYLEWYASLDNQDAILYFKYAVERAAIKSGYHDVPDLSEKELMEMIDVVELALDDIGEEYVTISNKQKVYDAIEKIVG